MNDHSTNLAGGDAPRFFPPVPRWRPDVVMPLNQIAERLRYYMNGAKDFAIFEHGTCVILEDGLDDRDAELFAKDGLQHAARLDPAQHGQNLWRLDASRRARSFTE